MTIERELNNESDVQQAIQIQAMYQSCSLMRNNSGACTNEEGSFVRYGLGNVSKQHNDRIKSSDLIGITKVVITQEMVGKTLGVFTAIEVKKEAWNENKKLDKRETAQLNFINWVKLMGGFAGFANHPDKIQRLLK